MDRLYWKPKWRKEEENKYRPVYRKFIFSISYVKCMSTETETIAIYDHAYCASRRSSS
jgi:hypothetical protein